MNSHTVTRSLQRVCQRQPFTSQICRQYIRQHHSSRPCLALPALLRNTRPTLLLQQQRRHESTASPLTDRPEHAQKPETAREEQPSYEMTFTCKACTTRSSHRISKQGYHHGTILITCPGCKNRHLISDHLKIFSDKSITIEDILQQNGQLLKKGTVGSEGDIEFWEDGSQTERKTPGK